MIDRYLQPPIAKALTPTARWLDRHGVSADHITIAGFIVGLGAIPTIASHHYLWGLFFIAANRVLDGVDGVLARASAPTDRGAFLDITLDFIFYATVPLAFAFARPENALPAAVIITSFVGTGSSFLAFSLLADRRGVDPVQYPTKGIFYLGGLTEGFETIAYFALICIFPNTFVALTYLYAGACFFTALLRVCAGYQAFSDTT